MPFAVDDDWDCDCDCDCDCDSACDGHRGPYFEGSDQDWVDVGDDENCGLGRAVCGPCECPVVRERIVRVWDWNSACDCDCDCDCDFDCDCDCDCDVGANERGPAMRSRQRKKKLLTMSTHSWNSLILSIMPPSAANGVGKHPQRPQNCVLHLRANISQRQQYTFEFIARSKWVG